MAIPTIPTNEKLILLIDGDQNTQRLLIDILKENGFKTKTANSAENAFQQLEKRQPDLIITETSFGETDGLTFIKNLTQITRVRNIPVMVLTQNHNAEDVSQVIAMGITHFIMKPFHRDDLLAKVKNVLTVPNEKQSITVIDKDKVSLHSGPLHLPGYEQILDVLRKLDQTEISPERNHLSMLGYEYPQITPFFKNFEAGIEFKFLEKMTKDNVLEPRLVDVVHLCPSCGHHDINFRELCPNCKSLNVIPVSYYRHKKCGQKIWIDQISDKRAFLCKTCDALLRPNSPEVRLEHTYRCLNCLYNISDIQMNCLCMKCGKIFVISDLQKQKIYAYRVKEKKQSKPLLLRNNSTILEKILQKISHAFLPLETFSQKIDFEILRAQRHQGALSLIAIDFQELFKMILQKKETSLTRLLLKSINLIDGALRRIDSISVKNQTQILILFPKMHQNLAKIVGQKILHDLANCHSIQLEMTLASYPEDGINSHEILNVLDLGLEKLKEQF